MASSELESLFLTKKDELLDLVTEAFFRTVGLHDIDISSIQLRATRRGERAHPGRLLSGEAVEHSDGSVTYEFVCRNS